MSKMAGEVLPEICDASFGGVNYPRGGRPQRCLASASQHNLESGFQTGIRHMQTPMPTGEAWGTDRPVRPSRALGHAPTESLKAPMDLRPPAADLIVPTVPVPELVHRRPAEALVSASPTELPDPPPCEVGTADVLVPGNALEALSQARTAHRGPTRIVQIHFCSGCERRLTDADMLRGRPRYRLPNGHSCRRCAQSSVLAPPADQSRKAGDGKYTLQVPRWSTGHR